MRVMIKRQTKLGFEEDRVGIPFSIPVSNAFKSPGFYTLIIQAENASTGKTMKVVKLTILEPNLCFESWLHFFFFLLHTLIICR